MGCIQSQRLPVYRQHAEKLIKVDMPDADISRRADQRKQTGQAYPCFCTQERLESVKQKFREARQLQSYDKHCATIPQEEAQQMREAGKPHVIRFSVCQRCYHCDGNQLTCNMRQNIPGRQASSFKDLVYGQVGSATIKVACEDFILVKSDGYPTYHFANVVDDHCMGISLVMRGEVGVLKVATI